MQDEHVQEADRQAHGQAAQQDAREHQTRPRVLDQQQVDTEQLRVQRRQKSQPEERGVYCRSAGIGIVSPIARARTSAATAVQQGSAAVITRGCLPFSLVQ